MELTINDILKVCHGKLICGDKNLICENFSKDTRNINKGDIYIGIKGENFDGNLFFKDAFKNEANACILDNSNLDFSQYQDKTIVIVKNSIIALQKLAMYKRSLYDIPVIAVTGSVGKTSTKELIASVLNTKYNVLVPIKNYNNHIGLPLTILSLKDHTACVLEMGMNHLKEISLLSKIAKPTIAVITNVGTSHIGNLGSRKNILKAKLEILDGMKKDNYLIINNDNDLLSKVKRKNLITVGVNNKSDYQAVNIDYKSDLVTFNCNDLLIESKNNNDAFIYNSLNAVAVGKLLNIENKSIENALNNYETNEERLEIKKSKSNMTIIDDAYNASYDSIKVALSVLKKYNPRKIAVLGDIKELGDYGIEIHQSLSKLIDENNIDILVTVGKLSNYIKPTNIKNNNFNNNEEAIVYLKEIIKKEDAILVKASNAMKFKEITEELIKL